MERVDVLVFVINRRIYACSSVINNWQEISKEASEEIEQAASERQQQPASPAVAGRRLAHCFSVSLVLVKVTSHLSTTTKFRFSLLYFYYRRLFPFLTVNVRNVCVSLSLSLSPQLVQSSLLYVCLLFFLLVFLSARQISTHNLETQCVLCSQKDDIMLVARKSFSAWSFIIFFSVCIIYSEQIMT